MHITDPLQIVAGLALPILALMVLLWIRQLVDDPSNDGLTVAFGIVVIVGILWIGSPLVFMGLDFWGQLAGVVFGG